ncbi:MAG: hypothetical protein HPY59_06490 [Anaerolineae bacterium]|nr:hypothetical protein [Anaerolineae bacterium]
MKNVDETNSVTSNDVDFRVIGGLLLLIIGSIILLDRYLHTGWLPLLILPCCGFLFVYGGVRMRRFGLVVTGCLLAGVGAGTIVASGRINSLTWQDRIGYGLLIFASAWFGITFLSILFGRGVAWWPLIMAGVIGGASVPFIFTKLSILDFGFFIAVGLGLAFLVWGFAAKLIGLIIPGSLLITIGPGIYFPWDSAGRENGLAQTGEMLVWFALGWILITLFSKMAIQRFIWWPLIPGGVLTMVGWGLYIGGNPQSAIGFIGNSGSVVLIIFGLYLLLLRRGIRK